jgi:O-antigen ligase
MMKTTMMFIVSLVVLDVVIIGGMVGVEKVVQRIENTNLQAQVAETGSVLRNVQKEQSFEERGEAALPALNIVRDFPFFGTGGGTFHLAFPHYRPAEVQGYFDHTHNDYVEIASETGLTGLLLLALAVLHSLWQSLKLFANGDEQLARGMAFASMMGVVSLLMHGAVDFNFQNPANAMLFLIILSLPYLLNRCKINA